MIVINTMGKLKNNIITNSGNTMLFCGILKNTEEEEEKTQPK